MEIFKYPSDIDTGGSAYCIISAFPWKLEIQKNLDNTVMYGSKSYRFHFLSYVPKDLQYSNNPKYAGIKTLGVTKSLSETTGFSEGGSGGTSWGRGGIEVIMNLADNLVSGLAETTGLADAYKVTKEQTQLGTNLWADPRLVNSFQEADNVSQKFTYQLLANNSTEADRIKLLVNTFKYAAQPERAASADWLPLLRSPLLFDIQVFTPPEETKGEQSFTLVRKYNWMNLVGINIKPITDSSRVDVPFYFDGNTLGYELSLDFKSIHPVVRPISDAGDEDGIAQKAINIVNGGGMSISQSAVRTYKKVQI